MVSRPEIEGERLIRKLLEQNTDYGGVLTYITGAMGGGKTSAMFAFLKYVYLDNETPRAQYYLQKSENINITSLDINIVGESGKISFPEDGYIEWTEIETVGSENGSPVVKKRNFYCKISNYQHGFINLSINTPIL